VTTGTFKDSCLLFKHRETNLLKATYLYTLSNDVTFVIVSRGTFYRSLWVFVWSTLMLLSSLTRHWPSSQLSHRHGCIKLPRSSIDAANEQDSDLLTVGARRPTTPVLGGKCWMNESWVRCQVIAFNDDVRYKRTSKCVGWDERRRSIFDNV